MTRKYRRSKRRRKTKRRRSRKRRAGLAPPQNENCKVELSDQKFAGCGTMRNWKKDEMCEPLDCLDYPQQREAYIKKHSSGKVNMKKASKNVSAMAAKLGKLNFGGPRPMGKRGPMPALPMPALPASGCSGPGKCNSKRAQESSPMCLSFGYNPSTGKSNCKWNGQTKKSSNHITQKRKTGDKSHKLTKKMMLPVEEPLPQPKPVPQLKQASAPKIKKPDDRCRNLKGEVSARCGIRHSKEECQKKEKRRPGDRNKKKWKPFCKWIGDKKGGKRTRKKKRRKKKKSRRRRRR